MCTCVGVILCKLMIQEKSNMAAIFVPEVQSYAICHTPAYFDEFNLVYTAV